MALTIYDIAKELRLSPATISRALNHPEQVASATRDRVLQFVHANGFVKRSYGAPPLPSGGKNTSVPFAASAYLLSIPTARNPFYEDIIEGAMSAAAERGCHILTDYRSLNEQTLPSFLHMAREHFRGVISLQPLTEALMLQLSATLPVVQCSESVSSLPAISSVTIDDIEAEKKATTHLIEAGCRSFVFVTSVTPYRFSVDRLHGFRLALDQASFPLREDAILQVPGMDHSIAYDTVLHYLRNQKTPDAMVCISDVFAAACIKAAAACSLQVPDDLRIVGFDNLSTAITTSPSITTIEQPRFQLGYRAFDLLYKETTSPQVPRQHIVLDTSLIPRESTAKKRRKKN